MSDEELLENWRRGSLRKMFQVILDEPISRKDMDSEYKLKKLYRKASLILHPDKADRTERAVKLATKMYTELKIKYEKKLEKIKEEEKEPENDMLEIEDMAAFIEKERNERARKERLQDYRDFQEMMTKMMKTDTGNEELELLKKQLWLSFVD